MTFQEQSMFQLLGSLLLKRSIVAVGIVSLALPAVASSQAESWFNRLTWSAFTQTDKTAFGPELTRFIAISEPKPLLNAEKSAAQVSLEVAYFPAFSCSAQIGFTLGGEFDGQLHEQILESGVPLEVSVDNQQLAYPYVAEMVEGKDGAAQLKLYLDADPEVRAAAQILIELGSNITVQIAGHSAKLSLLGSRDTILQTINRCENASAQ